MAEAGAAEGTVVLASEQTVGRGRKGRGWASPSGGLWMSVVLRPTLPPESWPLIGFAAGAGAAAALESVSGKTIQLKWPNDLVLDGRKVGGILVESAGGFAILGIGINANVAIEELPDDLRTTAVTLLASLGSPVDLAALARSILEQVEHFYDLMHRDPQAILDTWRRRSFLNGRRVQITGTRMLEGVAEDIDDRGALLIRTASGVQPVTVGDVSVRETHAR
jgi:BirA family biotin operon repressor/biotin-[acetyl-CoA-carboxylase] ligase